MSMENDKNIASSFISIVGYLRIYLQRLNVCGLYFAMYDIFFPVEKNIRFTKREEDTNKCQDMNKYFTFI